MEFFDSGLGVLLLGAATSYLTQLAKHLKVHPHLIVFGLAILLAIVYAAFTQFAGEAIVQETAEKAIGIASSASLIYEVLLSRLSKA